jgi:hypothetical protein
MHIDIDVRVHATLLAYFKIFGEFFAADHGRLFRKIFLQNF